MQLSVGIAAPKALKGAYKTGAGRTSPWRIPPAAIDYYQQHQPKQ
ncbi:hypothetical protein AAHB34_15890 [Paenarthrobacter ureafaciens]